MRNIYINQAIRELQDSDIKYKHKIEFLEVLRALEILHPWEVSDFIKLLERE